MRGSVAYANGRNFVGDDTAGMHCLDSASGEEIWRTPMDPLAGTHRSKISSSPIVYDGKVFFWHLHLGRPFTRCLSGRPNGCHPLAIQHRPRPQDRGWRGGLDRPRPGCGNGSTPVDLSAAAQSTRGNRHFQWNLLHQLRGTKFSSLHTLCFQHRWWLNPKGTPGCPTGLLD